MTQRAMQVLQLLLADGSSVTHDDTAPTLTNIAEATTGTGDANDGDTVSLTITGSEAIQQPVCTFQSGGANMANSPSYSGSGQSWTSSIVVADGDTNGAVTFSCTFEDTAGNAGAAADTTADSGDVTVDNTHPTVSTFSFDDTAMKKGDTPTLTLTFSGGSRIRQRRRCHLSERGTGHDDLCQRRRHMDWNIHSDR